MLRMQSFYKSHNKESVSKTLILKSVFVFIINRTQFGVQTLIQYNINCSKNVMQFEYKGIPLNFSLRRY